MGEHKGDFATDVRLLRISAIAAVGGALSTVAAYFLLHLIRFFANLFFYQTLSTANRSPSENTLGLIVVAVPVIGGLLVGLIARYGSEQVRGHGIPPTVIRCGPLSRIRFRGERKAGAATIAPSV